MPNIAPDDLIKLATDIFVAAGVPAGDADVVARMLADANLMGLDSHGVVRVSQYVGNIGNGSIVPGAEVTVAEKSATTAIVDGNWNFGQVAASRAARWAIDKARQQGLGCAVLRRCRHVGRVGAYTEMAAEADCIGLATCSAGSEGHWVAPFGGREGRLSTNPISFAAPTEDQPIVMDFSTSAAPEGKVRLFRDTGRPLPEPWVVDKHGKATTDPNDLYDASGARTGAILPFGGEQGYKSFGLSLMVQILSGALGDPSWMNEGAESMANTMWFLAIDIGAFMPAADFHAEMTRMANYIQSSQAAAGSDGVIMPGQREADVMEERQRTGIPIAEGIWQQLLDAAQTVGLDVDTVARLASGKGDPS